MAEEGNRDLEALIEESLRISPSFEKAHPARAKAFKKTLTERLLPLSAAAANAALSFPGNPAYTPAAICALTYILASKAARLSRLNSKINTATYGNRPYFASNMLFEFKGLISAVSGIMSFAVPYSAKNFEHEAGSLLNFTPEMAYGLLSGFGTYIALTGMQHLAHPQSLFAEWHMLRKKALELKGQNAEAISHLERLAEIPHSKEKEIELLQQLGDACASSNNIAGAFDAYKRIFLSAMRTDCKTGISDWLISGRRGVHAPDSIQLSYLQQAMHEFAAGNYERAHSLLADAVRAEPNNKDIHRIRALFFHALEDKSAADLEMRIFVELAIRDFGSNFELVGKSRNKVLRLKGGRTPDIYLKIGPISHFEDEARNISAFSQEIPGSMPAILGMYPAEPEGKAEAMAVESKGNATMLEKAIACNLTEQDVKSTINLLIEVLITGERLRNQGKIKVAEPLSLPTYTYSNQAILKSLGRDVVVQNYGELAEEKGMWQIPLYFTHRVNDLFILGVQEHNSIAFPQEFADKVTNGAAVLGGLIVGHPLVRQGVLNKVNTDFTHPNIIFESLSGPLKGKIDWEQIKLLPVMFELVNILEFYRTNFTTSQIQAFQQYFLNRFEHAFRVKIGIGQFSLLYQRAAVIRHLELISYRSRDTAFNPQSASAQVYHHLMARMYLPDVIAKANFPKDNPAKAMLEEMLWQLDTTPIMNDAKQQKELESEVRLHAARAMPSLRYLSHEVSQRAYWKEFFRFDPGMLRRPHPVNTPYRKGSLAESLASGASILIEAPAALATAGTFDTALYFALQTIMPSL